MLRSYIRVALRQLRRQGIYAAINVLGLAVGIAVSALIFLFVRDELTFDRQHEKGDRIFRVVTGSAEPGATPEAWYSWQPMPMGPSLERDLPDVEAAVRVNKRLELVRRGEVVFESDILFADRPFFDVFDFPLVRGDSRSALESPDQIVLGRGLAERLFGAEDPMGQTMEIYLDKTFYTLQVVGITEDPPPNSSIQFTAVVPWEMLMVAFPRFRARTENWRSSSFFTYVLLGEGSGREVVEAKLPQFYLKYRPDNAEREQPVVHALQPIREVHLNTNVSGGITPASDPQYSMILAAIALAILALACINFTTLAIGRSVSRAREVGVRKASGARRVQLMMQFWGEAILLAFFALVVGLAMAEAFLPEFNALAGKDLSFQWAESPVSAVALVTMTVLVGLFAGAYPSLVLSGLRPVESLAGNPRLGGARLTKALVVVQFGLTVFLAVGTLVMREQLGFMQDMNLGYDKENLVIVDAQGYPGGEVADRFEDLLASDPRILGVSAMTSSFSHGWSREGWDYRGEGKMAYVNAVEDNILDVLGIQLLEGRTFDPARSTDSTSAVIVNEAFVRMMEWDEPLGQVIEGFYAEPEVVGIYRDVNFLSLREAMEPQVLTMDPDWGRGEVMVRIAPGNVRESIAAIDEAWRAVAPELPMVHYFADEEVNAQYASEERWSRIVAYAAGFALVIACLGLLGLAALAVAGRTKEVGIRKVLGATVSGIAALLSRDFALLVVIGTLLATPAVYVVAERWLTGFAYRISFPLWLPIAVALAVLALAMVTVGFQTLRAANADPARSLRYE